MEQRYRLMKIFTVTDHGIYVKLDKKTNALCPANKMRKKKEKYNAGNYIWVKEIENENPSSRKHIVEECPYMDRDVAFDKFVKCYAEGDMLKGCVASIDGKMGIFINIFPWFNGLLHVSEYDTYYNNEMEINKIVTVQIGKIDEKLKRVSLIPAYKKNVYVSAELEGVEKDKFLDSVEISNKVCDSYRECTENYSIKDYEIKKIIADSYFKAVVEDAVLIHNDSFTFQIEGKTRYGGAIAVGGKKNQREGKLWFVNFIGSSSKLVGNAIDIFAQVGDWADLLTSLERKILRGENWNYKKSKDAKTSSGELFILKQYLNYTFYCARNRGLISITQDEDFAVFNTGLVDNVYEAVYMCFVPSDEGVKKKWKYEGFCTYGTGHLGKMLNSKMAEPPQKVQYFTSINDMLFDTTKKLNWDKEHILIENIDRLPIEFIEDQCDNADLENIGLNIESIKKNKNKQINFENICTYITENIRLKRKLLNRMDDAVSLAVKRCEWNYKTAIPIYYHVTNGISLLLPLCLSDDEQSADVALVVEKQESGNYQGQTILTLQMAYLDARLICRPNSEWLNPELMIEEEQKDK